MRLESEELRGEDEDEETEQIELFEKEAGTASSSELDEREGHSNETILKLTETPISVDVS